MNEMDNLWVVNEFSPNEKRQIPILDPNDNELESEVYDLERNENNNLTSLMDKPFDPTKIDIDTKTPSLDTLIKRIRSKNVQLETESYFQRKDDLWDVVKQSRLIESILIRFPLPAFFFDATDDNKWLVVDGLQRLSSIRNFVVNKTLKLTKLEFLSHLDGCFWDDLPEDLQRIIEESQVVIYKIMPGTPTDVKFNIFKRINTGGLVLEPQEIRHALFQGKPADFIAELAQSNSFIKATGGKIKTHRMLDRDFVNRFLCFYLLSFQEYNTDLDTYMSKAMASIYEKSKQELDQIKDDFNESMELCRLVFKEEAFRKVTGKYERLPPINKAIFDALSVAFAVLDKSEREVVKKFKSKFKLDFKNLLANDIQFFTSVTSSTGDRGRVHYRHSTLQHFVYKLINENND